MLFVNILSQSHYRLFQCLSGHLICVIWVTATRSKWHTKASVPSADNHEDSHGVGCIMTPVTM